MAYQEAGAEARAGLALRQSCLRGAPGRLVGAERIDEDGIHSGHIAGGERHLAAPKNGRAGKGQWMGRRQEEVVEVSSSSAAAAVRDDRRKCPGLDFRRKKEIASRPQTDGQRDAIFSLFI